MFGDNDSGGNISSLDIAPIDVSSIVMQATEEAEELSTDINIDTQNSQSSSPTSDEL